jgi:6-phosphogluconolactonase
MSFQPDVEVFPNSALLAERAAEEFVRLSEEAFQTRARFVVALAGGSTPRQMYTRLIGAHIDWEHIHFFWGNERCVPISHADSNYRMTDEALLSHIPIPAGNIHRIPGELPVEEAARIYEGELRHFFGGEPASFNLILLGMGEDGHTASLFPGTPATREKVHWVSPVNHPIPPPPLVKRVTLTFPILNLAARVLFLVSGVEKAERLAQVLYGTSLPDLLPAQAVKPVDGSVHWLVDQAAAVKFPKPLQHMG